MRVLCITEHSDRPEAETIIGLKHAGVDIHVLCPTSAPYYQKFADAGVSVTPLKLKSRIDLKAIPAIRRTIIEKKIDILHLFNNQAIQNGIIAARHLPVKIVAYRGIVANVSFFDPGSWMTYLHPRVDRIICVCEAVRLYFLKMKCLWLKVASEKPVTIYKGHNLAWYQDTPGDLSRFNLPEDAFVVGCTANFRPRKGIHVLVDAMRHIPESFPIHLLLIGNMESTKLKKQIQKSPRGDRVHMAGFRKDAAALQASCDTVVLPAIKREGLPKVIIEAMAYGIPPIVTDSGGSPELIEDGTSGIVVPAGDSAAIAQAIIGLFKDPATRKHIGRNARMRIEKHFRVEDTIQQTLDLYRELSGSG